MHSGIEPGTAENCLLRVLPIFRLWGGSADESGVEEEREKVMGSRKGYRGQVCFRQGTSKTKGAKMAKIIILDDDHASSAFLKIILTRHWHRVSRTADIQEVTNHPSNSTPELVLINQAFRNYSGWKMFNYLKRIAPHIPAMVYGLDQLNTANADWIVKAVEAAIGETKTNIPRHPDSSVRSTLFAE